MPEKKQLSILITAGGTQEDIDTVRSITNHSTGRLGSLIADIFLQNGAKVTFLCGEALKDTPGAHETIKIRSTAQLAEKLENLLRENAYDCVIHSMAVSDFTPHAIMPVDEITEAIRREISAGNLPEDEISERIRNAVLNGTAPYAVRSQEKKISSKSPYLALILKQTPKVIERIKKIRPKTLLVGFKLLSGATEGELTQAALALIKSCGCDYVLANDLNDISGDKHKAVLVGSGGVLDRAATKPDIARMIFNHVIKALNERGREGDSN